MAIKISVGTDLSAVKNIEFQYGVLFPVDYAEFLIRYNGLFIGPGSYCTLPFLKADDENIDFQEIYGINSENPLFDLVRANEIRDDVVLFDFPFIIGADPGGNPLLINGNGNDHTVYYWDRTLLHTDDNVDYQGRGEAGNIYTLFDSFTDLYAAIIANIGGDQTIIQARL